MLACMYEEAGQNNTIHFIELLPVSDCSAEGIFRVIDEYFR